MESDQFNALLKEEKYFLERSLTNKIEFIIQPTAIKNYQISIIKVLFKRIVTNNLILNLNPKSNLTSYLTFVRSLYS
jgi:hypothetical protein